MNGAKEITAEDFKMEYEALCRRMGYRIVVVPAYVARDDNTFSTVLQVGVEPLPKDGGADVRTI